MDVHIQYTYIHPVWLELYGMNTFQLTVDLTLMKVITKAQHEKVSAKNVTKRDIGNGCEWERFKRNIHTSEEKWPLRQSRMTGPSGKQHSSNIQNWQRSWLYNSSSRDIQVDEPRNNSRNPKDMLHKSRGPPQLHTPFWSHHQLPGMTFPVYVIRGACTCLFGCHEAVTQCRL